jgi:acetolactate synthase-1/2/3 large subunit
MLGQRAANIIQQKADNLLCLGARLDNEQVGWRYDNFAPHAVKVVYDVDQAELDKLPDDWKKRKVDLSAPNLGGMMKSNPEWLTWCKNLYNSMPTILPEHFKEQYFVNPYVLIDWMNNNGRDNDIFAIGSSGLAPCTFLQAFKVRKGQMVRNVCSIGAMGADIPMAIGAAIANPFKRIICLTGDGGFMQNVQELEVVSREFLNIKFFVFNNGGYGSIRNMQNARFEGRKLGCDYNSGLSLPSLEDVAKTYRIRYQKLNTNWDLQYIDNIHGSVIYDVNVSPAFQNLPRVGASLKDGAFQVDDMEDMTPKIDITELMNYDR